jgi:hypothetical protein
LKRAPRRLLACLALAAAACAPAEERARDSALRYFAAAAQAPDPSWSYLIPYLSRRYSISVEHGPLRLPKVYARFADPLATATVAEIAALDSPVDRILAMALHCDRLGLPADWLGILERAGDRGGYGLTHAILAAGWTRENGCLAGVDLSLLRTRQLEELMVSFDALAESDTRAADIWVEGLALFTYAGGNSRVRPEWLARLRSLQRADGGFPEHPGDDRSSDHTTAFAVWALLADLGDAKGEDRMIPR